MLPCWICTVALFRVLLVLGSLGMSKHALNCMQASNSVIKARSLVIYVIRKSIVSKSNYILIMSVQNFEYKAAMDRLEEILSKIDNSEMEIDELAGQVQEATELLRKCRQILLTTEKNVQEALASLDGETEA